MLCLGELGFWKLGEHFLFARTLMLSMPGNSLSDGTHSLWDDSTIFIVVGSYSVARELYNKARLYRVKSNKLLLTTELKGIGNSSLFLRTTILDPVTKEFLASLDFKYVMVDRFTRKAMPVPVWFRNKYTKLVPGQHIPKRFEELMMPDAEQKHYCKVYTALPSDLDYNEHVNNNVYFRLCFDAATEASVVENCFSNFTGDICNYNVESATCVYEKECSLGDVLHIWVWEDLRQANVLSCKIMKGQQVSFQCTLTFYGYQPMFTAKL